MDIPKENKLENILRLAADEPAHRPEFSALLLESTIYLLGATDENVSETAEVNLDAGDNISIQNWEDQDGKPVIPFFTSLEVLQQSIEQEQSYLALQTRSLFEMTIGNTLFLNPKSDYGKEFVPQEIESLLSTGLCQQSTQRVTEKETNVLLGQPSDYPSKMIDSLTQLFAKHKKVSRAYLALMHDTAIDEKAHLLIGIEVKGDIKSILKEAGNVAGDTAPNGDPVDIYQVDSNDSGLSHYLINDTKPFYERKLDPRFFSLFGGGKA